MGMGARFLQWSFLGKRVVIGAADFYRTTGAFDWRETSVSRKVLSEAGKTKSRSKVFCFLKSFNKASSALNIGWESVSI
jgi:hypothetical protein